MPTAIRVLKDEKYRLAAEKAAGVSAREAANQGRTAAADVPRGRCASCRPTSKTTLSWRTVSCGCIGRPETARWLREAQSLVDRMIADFEDKEEGGFFFTASDHEQLLARAKDPFDNALPSGNSVAILDLIEIYRITRQTSYLDRAGKALAAFGTAIVRVPAALPLMLVGLGPVSGRAAANRPRRIWSPGSKPGRSSRARS